VDPSSLDGRDSIGYRTLTKADFLAEEPPEEMRAYAKRMGAVTCAHLISFPDPVYTIRQSAEGFDGSYNNLDFVARMDRECSWWNPELGEVPPEYVLEHEQIHFALAESAARRLNERAHALKVRLRPRGDTREEVERQLVEPVQELLNGAISDLLEVNLRFDEDTSNTYAPDKQLRWRNRVMAQIDQ
jgi:hypothetical protein